MLFTAISYGKLVRQFPEAGSAYTYAQKSISPHVGFMVGWSSLLDYLFTDDQRATGEDLSVGAVSGSSAVGVGGGICGDSDRGEYQKRQSGGQLQYAVCAGADCDHGRLYFPVVQGLHKGEGVGTVWSLQPFISQNAHLIPIITGATIVCFSFLGFDAVTTLSEETPDAARTIPKAIFLTAVYGGIIFIVASFFMQLFSPISAALGSGCGAAGNCAVRRRETVPVDFPLYHLRQHAGVGAGVARQRLPPAVCHGAR